MYVCMYKTDWQTERQTYELKSTETNIDKKRYILTNKIDC